MQESGGRRARKRRVGSQAFLQVRGSVCPLWPFHSAAKSLVHQLCFGTEGGDSALSIRIMFNIKRHTKFNVSKMFL